MVDTWFGYLMRKIENMGLMDNTAIIFTTDHGFYFGEHNNLFGKLTLNCNEEGVLRKKTDSESKWGRSPLYEELVAIPLFIYVPGLSSGITNELTSAIDIMPTVLDIMGFDIPKSVEGISLLRCRD